MPEALKNISKISVYIELASFSCFLKVYLSFYQNVSSFDFFSVIFTWTGGTNLHSHALCYAHCDSRECVSRRSSALFSTHTFQAVLPAEISLKLLPTIMYDKDTKKGPVTFAFQNIIFTDEGHPPDTLMFIRSLIL